MNPLSEGRPSEEQNLQYTQKEGSRQSSCSQGSSKPKVSRGSLLFNEMQVLTKTIRSIDNVQQKMFQQNLLRSNSRQARLISPKKVTRGSLNNVSDPAPPTVTQLINKYKYKEPQEEECARCRRKQHELVQLQNRVRSISRKLQSKQKQVQQLGFRLDLAEAETRNVQRKQLVDPLKTLIRKSLDAFVSGVVLPKIRMIDSSVEWLNKKILKIAGEGTLRKIQQHRIKSNVEKLTGSTGIRVPRSASANQIKLFSSSRTSDTSYNEAMSLRALQTTLKQKDNLISELEEELLSAKKSNIQIIAQYGNHIEKLTRLNIQKELVYGAKSVQGDLIAKLKQLEEKLAVSQKQYHKLNEKYLAVCLKEEELNNLLEQNRTREAMFERYRWRCETAEKEILLQARQLEDALVQLMQQKYNNNSNILVINKLRQRLKEMQFELGMKQSENETINSISQSNVKFMSYEKQIRMFEDSNNRVKNQVQRLNENVQMKSRQLELVHDQYGAQLYQKESKLSQLEMLLEEDFSKIRGSKDYDCRLIRDCDNSLVLSTTKMINASRDLDFCLTEEDVILPELLSMEQLFTTKDFSKVQLDTHYDQQWFLKKVSEYVDSIKQSQNRRVGSRSKSRHSPSQQKLGSEMPHGQLKKLVQIMLVEVNRINREVPLLIKDQFFKLKNLLDRFRQQLLRIESNNAQVDEIKELCLSLMRSLPRERSNNQLDEIVRRLQNLLWSCPT